ncbi:MAG: dihydroorotate dehydrogenase-like protein [Candidatus Latescibacterota bacterium]|nr:MAG: dihydroorotate dehydrogenase-like protein [Candidatus Latescibacterota bacterium]
MDLSTTYLGITLRNPLVPAASPLSRDLDTPRRLEENGAAAIVMQSLFEEEIVHDQHELHWHTELGTESFAESLSYLPEHDSYEMFGEDYLERLYQLKKALEIPVIASLNGATTGGWTRFAEMFQEAGADAIELNIYFLATEAKQTSQEVEQRYVDILTAVRESVTIPVAVKLGPFFSAFANMARRLDDAGADGLVLFNRFYQPDIDLEEMSLEPNVLLSTPQAMRLPLRWIAILRDQVKASLAATSGIHTGRDVIKMLLAGADIAQIASVLLMNGPKHLKTLLAYLRSWMEEREYASVEQLKGSMSYSNVPNPGEFERANYMRALKSYR